MKWLGHTLAVLVVLAAMMPMAKWYMNANPMWGVDFFYTVSLTKVLASGLALPAMTWNYAWFTGWPWVSGFPLLHNYFVLLFSLGGDYVWATKVWMVVTLGLFFVGAYVSFYSLSKNMIVAAGLAVGAIYSVGVYGTLMWGGSLPSAASQLFFPWTVWAIIKFVQSRNWKWVWIAGGLAGLAILGHPLAVIAYIFPTVTVILWGWYKKGQWREQVRAWVVFMVVAGVMGLPILYKSAGGALKFLVVTGSHQVETASSTVKIEGENDVEAFHKRQPWRIVEDTNRGLFVALGVAAGLWVVAIIMGWRRAGWVQVTVFAVVAGMYVVYITMYGYGVSIYHGGWYRLFWSTPLWLGWLVAAMWGGVSVVAKNTMGRGYVAIATILGVIVVVIAGGVGMQELAGIRQRIVLRSTESSAFPDVVNLRATKATFDKLKREMVPSWLDGDQTNYRLYTADQTVNIWWNSLFKMPLSRGYYDPPVGEMGRSYFFWLDAALSKDLTSDVDQLAGTFGYTPEAALNNTLYLLDWYAIRYLEAGHAGLTTYAPLPLSISSGDKYIKQKQELEFNKEKWHTGRQTLNYWEIRDEYVSPIMQATNAPVIGVVAGESGFETINRLKADTGWDSRRAITVNLGKNLDKLSLADLQAMDMLVLYDYDYWDKNKAFGIVEAFLKLGKSVYVETGVENKETRDAQLPEIYPVAGVVRSTLGPSWDLKASASSLFTGVDVTKFAEPIFDGDPWSFSYTEVALRSGSEEILANHGRIIMASTTKHGGKLVWSGMNLPYHIVRYHNAHEIKLWTNLMTELLPKTTPTSPGIVKFVSGRERTLATTGAKGVLFKEQAYPGWVASEGLKRYKIYRAGPAYPGFMYISLGPDTGQKTVNFSYWGAWQTWLLTVIVFGMLLLIADAVLLNSKLRKSVQRMFKLTIVRKWDKDDEY